MKSLLCAVSCLLLLVACTSSSIEPEPSSQPLTTGAGLAGQGGIAGAGGTSEAGSAGTAGSSEAGAAGVAGSSPVLARCPSGKGAEMVLVQGPRGPFCIDRTETKKGEYKAFLDDVGSNAKALKEEHKGLADFPQCAEVNYGFGPEGIHDSSDWNWNPWEFMYSIDLCDAHAYCKWSGKRLCGNTDGKPGTLESASSPGTSEWMWVCTNGGTTKFSTGNEYKEGSCPRHGGGTKPKEGKENPCHGQGSPFDNIEYIMSGVVEFTSECSIDKDGINRCPIRGSDFNYDTDGASCSYIGTVNIQTFANIGIRCCADAMP